MTRRNLALFLFVLILSTLSFAADKMKPEELVAKHLDAIAKPEVRASIKNMMVTGGTKMEIVTGGAGYIDGSLEILSSGAKDSTLMKFATANYQQEGWVYDGDKSKILQIRPGVRSKLGTLLEAQSWIVKEGLLGGVLSTSWPLLNVAEKQPKLSNDGLKKVNGKELYQLTYKPKKGGGDVNIKIYFDPATFQHVMTVYTLTYSPRLSSGAGSGSATQDEASRETGSASQNETRIRLEELFDDFSEEFGQNLPHKWTIKLTSEGGVGTGGTTANQFQSSIIQWTSAVGKVETNTEFPPISAN